MKEKKYHHGSLRTHLLETAVRMISQQGLHKVTMRALSEAVGVSRTAAYRHFKNKSDLLSAVAEEGFAKLTRRFQEINANTYMDSFVRFQLIGLQYIEFAVNFPGYYRLMFGDAIVQQEKSSKLLQAAQLAFSELQKSVEICQKERRIKQTDPLLLANTVWAWAHGLSMLLIDGQLDITEQMHLLPALVTENSKHYGEGIEHIVLFSMDMLTQGIKR